MTNFDKFKSEMTVDDLINFIADGCDSCPAKKYCDGRRGACVPIMREWLSQEADSQGGKN